MNNTWKYQFEAACDIAGLTINGSAVNDPQIHDAEKFYKALEGNPLLALGESYAAGHYDVKDVWEMIYALVKADMNWDIQKLLTISQKLRLWSHYMWWRLNVNKFKWWQSRIANDHYDLDNPLMLSMFWRHKKYTSAFYYPQYGEFDLDLYQELDLNIAWQRMWLKEWDRLCDWGFWFWTNTKYLVERFGVKVTGITISQEQYEYAKYICKDISDSVNLILMDYRDVTPEKLGTFDHVCFFEMIESIWWPKNYFWFFNNIKNILKKDGNVFGQILGRNNPSHQQNDWIDRSHATEPFIDKYIFKWWVLTRIPSLIAASERAGLFPRLIDNSLGRANAETCKAWNKNFHDNWDDLKDTWEIRQPSHALAQYWPVLPNHTSKYKYQNHFRDRFPYEMTEEVIKRIWEYYLLSSSAGHKAGLIHDGHYVWENNPENVSKPDIQIPQTREEVLSVLWKKRF